MDISIPLFSPALLVSAALVALGFLGYPFSARFGVAAIGAGSIIMGGVVLADMPEGISPAVIPIFGITIVVGIWMIYIAVRHG